MIYIIGQENVLLKQPRGDRTLKMHHFSKKYEKVIFQPPVNPQRTPSEPPANPHQKYFFKFFSKMLHFQGSVTPSLF